MMNILLPALGETIYMSLVSTAFAVIIGFGLAIILMLTSKGGLRENIKVYSILDVLINTLRSFPFIILMIVLFPDAQDFDFHHTQVAAVKYKSWLHLTAFFVILFDNLNRLQKNLLCLTLGP